MSYLKEKMNLKGRVALVTGGCGFLGRMMSKTLAQMGADLILLDHSPSMPDQMKEEIIQESSVNIEFISCDLENGYQRKDAIQKILTSRNSLSILINNAAFVGTSELRGWAVPFAEQDVETWRRAIEVNLTAIFEFCQGLSPLLKASKGACVINVGSIYGMCGPDWSLYEGTNMGNPAAYAASKGGLIQLTRWLATTLAPEVRVNTISPGGIWRNQLDSFTDKYCARTPLARMAIEEDLIGAIAFLASDMSSYVTGHNLIIDGGWTAW